MIALNVLVIIPVFYINIQIFMQSFAYSFYIDNKWIILELWQLLLFKVLVSGPKAIVINCKALTLTHVEYLYSEYNNFHQLISYFFFYKFWFLDEKVSRKGLCVLV